MQRFTVSAGIALCAVMSGPAHPAAAQPGPAQPANSSTLLSSMRDRFRPLLIFAGSSDQRVQQQYRVLASNASGVQDRQVRIVLVTTTATPAQPPPPAGTVSATLQQQKALRSQFQVSPGSFTVILVGKDGGEKFRSTTPVSFATLTHIIDAMPMRQQEMQVH